MEGKQDLPEEFWRMVALHEAGHAIVATEVGLDVLLIALEPMEGVPGGCLITQPTIPFLGTYLRGECPPDLAKRLWDNALYQIGGIVAEERMGWNSGQARRKDEEGVRQFHSLLSLGAIDLTFEDFTAEIRRRAHRLLQRNTRALDAVARELCEQRSITGLRLREIIAQAAQKGTIDGSNRNAH